MTDERTSDPTTATRRTVLTYGALVPTGVAVVDRAAASESENRAADAADVEHAAMFPHQITPGATFELAATDLEWLPGALDAATYRTQVIEYGYSSTYRAFLFSDGRLGTGTRYRLDASDTATAPGRRFVGVSVERADD